MRPVPGNVIKSSLMEVDGFLAEQNGSFTCSSTKARGNRVFCSLEIEQKMNFEQKVCEQIPGLTRYAFVLCGERALAEDLVQDCMERALRKRHLWRPSSTVKPWLFRMLYRIYLNHRSSARVRRESLTDNISEEIAIPSGHEATLQYRDAMAAIERLPEDQRAALLLMVLENPSYKEAAKILGVNAGTLRSRVSRAREFVRQACTEKSGQVPEGLMTNPMKSPMKDPMKETKVTSGGTVLRRVW